jgi:hypothetical protein
VKHTPLDHPLNALRMQPAQRLALLSIFATRAPDETRDIIERLRGVACFALLACDALVTGEDDAATADDARALAGSCEVLLAELAALTDARTPEQRAAAEAAARRALAG